MGTPLGLKYILYSYMDPLGMAMVLDILCCVPGEVGFFCVHLSQGLARI